MTDYDIVTYAAMLADRGRVEAYARALERRVAPGCTVLDLGTGTGLFALLACRAGAARVYAVEPDDVVEVAREMARANGFADRITFIQARSTSIDLPEPVDGIVADVRGTLPLFRDAVRAMIDARERFLKTGGWIVPSRDTLVAAVASSPLVADVLFGEYAAPFGLDTSAVSRHARTMSFRHRPTAANLLTDPRAWATLDYDELASTDAAGEAEWIVNRPGTGHGLSLWFDCETAPGIAFTNSPASTDPHIYGQLFLPWLEPVHVVPGDRVAIELRADLVNADYLWRWKTRIEPADAGEARCFTQSSFVGTILSVDRVRRRAETFVPALNDDAQIDRLALSLMARGRSLGQVAGVLIADYPRRFATFSEALTHVADLSERYAP